LIETIYQCDRCTREGELASEFWNLEILAQPLNQWMHRAGQPTSIRTAHWCVTCMRMLGLVGDQTLKLVTEEEPELTLEDMVREICREEIKANESPEG
jgi:hypothetical protein